MGYAIIKDINSNKGYALNRLIQNLIPVDDTKWVYINKNSVSFSYKEGDALGTYVLESVDLGNATLPYEYELVNSPTGAAIDPISGVVTLDSTFEGTTLTVKLKALYNVYGLYYPPTSTYTNEFKTTTIQVSDQHHVPAVPTYTVTNINLAYPSSPIVAAGGSSTPTLTYTLNKTVNGETTQSSERVSISYSADVPVGGILNASTGKITLPKNNGDLITVTVTVTIIAPDGSQWQSTDIVSQNGKALTGIEFYSYDGDATINIEANTTVYAKDISLTLVYDTGNDILPASENNNILIAQGSTGALQNAITFTSNGNYTMYIYYGGKVTTLTVTVAALLTSISVANLTLVEGSPIGSATTDPEGEGTGTIQATANYSDGTTSTVTATVTPAYVIPGTYEYTATYQSYTAKFTITATDMSSDTLIKVIPIPADTSVTALGNALTLGSLSHSSSSVISDDGGTLLIGSSSSTNYRKHYCTYGTLKKYYIINPHPHSIAAFVLADNKVTNLNNASSGDSFACVKSAKAYRSDSTVPVLVIFNPTSAGNTLYLGMLGSNDISTSYVLKEGTVN